MSLARSFFQNPMPLRYLFYRKFMNLFAAHSDFARPHYKYCIEQAFVLARQLRKPAVSVIEFGVAGGNGLVCVERICEQQKRRTGIDFKIYGFDAGEGLPEPKDYRDRPYLFGPGFYRMDYAKLKSRLKYSELIIGNVSQTARDFVAKYEPPPIGCVLFDLDYYSSTMDAFKIFDEGQDRHFLPRVYCYFDDIECIDALGERAAIRDFNQQHPHRVIQNNPGAEQWVPRVGWKIYEFHNFGHVDYATSLMGRHDLPLK